MGNTFRNKKSNQYDEGDGFDNPKKERNFKKGTQMKILNKHVDEDIEKFDYNSETQYNNLYDIN